MAREKLIDVIADTLADEVLALCQQLSGVLARERVAYGPVTASALLMLAARVMYRLGGSKGGFIGAAEHSFDAVCGAELPAESAVRLTTEELHVVWTATTRYLAEVMTGETVILTDGEQWKAWLNSAVQKLSRAKVLEGSAMPEREA